MHQQVTAAVAERPSPNPDGEERQGDRPAAAKDFDAVILL